MPNFIQPRIRKPIVMKKVWLLLALICLLVFSNLVQSQEIVRIKAGEDPASAYSPHGFYRYPHFSQGLVVFKHGGQTNAKMNYHMLNGEMQFITQGGDTLALADPFSIKYLTLDSALFFYNEGYLEVILNNEKLKLAKKVRLETQWEKIGAYGQASPSGSIRTPNKLILGNIGKNLSQNQNILVRKEYSYYWLDKYGTILKANKANLLKLIAPDSKNKIDDYLKANKIDYNKEEDLKRLLEFALTI